MASAWALVATLLLLHTLAVRDYLALVERRFGAQQRHNVEEMARIPLKRRLLGD